MATWPCGEPRGPDEGGWGPSGPTHPGSPPLGPSQVLAGVGGQVRGLEGHVQEAPEAWLLSHLPSLPEHLTLGIGAPTSAPPRLGLASGPSKWPVLSSQAGAQGFPRHVAEPQSSVVAPRAGPRGRGRARAGPRPPPARPSAGPTWTLSSLWSPLCWTRACPASVGRRSSSSSRSWADSGLAVP